MCQILVPKAVGPGRTPAVEILIPTSAIRHLIREDKLHQVYSAMQSSSDAVGMQTMNQSLESLYARRMITLDDAIGYSSNREELRAAITRRSAVQGGGGTHALPGSVQTARRPRH